MAPIAERVFGGNLSELCYTEYMAELDKIVDAELAEGVDTPREPVVIHFSECELCATWTNVCAKTHPCFPDPNQINAPGLNQSMHKECSIGFYVHKRDTHNPLRRTGNLGW